MSIFGGNSPVNQCQPSQPASCPKGKPPLPIIDRQMALYSPVIYMLIILEQGAEKGTMIPAQTNTVDKGIQIVIWEIQVFVQRNSRALMSLLTSMLFFDVSQGL